MLLEMLNALYEENQLLRDEIARLKVKNQSPIHENKGTD